MKGGVDADKWIISRVCSLGDMEDTDIPRQYLEQFLKRRQCQVLPDLINVSHLAVIALSKYHHRN